LGVWLQCLKKVQYNYDIKKKIEKIQKGIKNAEFHADFKSVGKVLRKCTKKVISKTSLMNMSKSGKSAYFCHVFANSNLSTDLKSA
jgi:hypothetical protein